MLMLTLTRRSWMVIIALIMILALCGTVTYFVFFSPSGLKARERSDLNRIQADEGTSYTRLDGNSVDLDAYRGNVLIVNVWASWSPYTASDHGTLSRVKESYGEKVTILAMNRMETKETAEAYLGTIGKESGIEYIIDGSDHFFTSLGGYAMPETIVFDRVGNIYLHTRGTISETELVTALETLLKE